MALGRQLISPVLHSIHERISLGSSKSFLDLMLLLVHNFFYNYAFKKWKQKQSKYLFAQINFIPK